MLTVHLLPSGCSVGIAACEELNGFRPASLKVCPRHYAVSQ